MGQATAQPQHCRGTAPDGTPCPNLAWADGYCATCFVTISQDRHRVQGGGQLHHAQVRRCHYRWQPVPKPGSRYRDWRPCNGAILAPASLCHRHGGPTETDLGRTYTEAIHAAQNDKLTLPDPSWWQAPQRRWETLGGRGVSLFAAYPDAWAETWNLVPERWLRLGDRVAAMAAYLDRGLRDGYEDDDLTGFVIAQMAQPHLPPRRWASFGLHPRTDATGLPTTRKVLTAPVVIDPAWTEQQAWGATAMSPGMSVPILLFAESETDGGPHRPVPMFPPGRPVQHLDPETAEARFVAAAATRGWTLEVGIARPTSGVAHFDRDRRVATVFHGLGDRRTRLWALAHTAGHLALGHGDCGDDRTLPHEAEAEAFAVLAMHRAGLFDSGSAATWRSLFPVDLKMLAFDRLRAATAACHWLV